jgi:hypothetical protein
VCTLFAAYSSSYSFPHHFEKHDVFGSLR